MSSQVNTPLNTVDGLLQVEKIGESCFKEFLKNHIETNNVDYEPTKKLKLRIRIFDKRSALTKIKVKKKDVAISSEHETFARLLVIEKNRNISLKKVMQFELSPTPKSISNLESSTTLRRTAKTELFKHLKSSIEMVEEIPENTPNIYDGMVVFQKLLPTLASFGDTSDYILQKIMKSPSRFSLFITDYYLEDSLKSFERRCRSDIGLVRMKAS